MRIETALTSASAWQEKLGADIERAGRFLAGSLREVNREILRRAQSLGAEAIILTGSTARGRRTSISDLDYLIVGSKPRVSDLEEEVDITVASPERLLARLARGDSFSHWALDHGCILLDTGIVREALARVVGDGLSPDPALLKKQFSRFRQFATELAASGDADAAHRETLAALSLGARWWLLARGVSPLARSELPIQLRQEGEEELASALEQLIYGRPSLEAQSAWLLRGIGDDSPVAGARSNEGSAQP
jgi:hypothetical protein